MKAVFGVSWDDKKRFRLASGFLAALFVLPFLANPTIADRSAETAGTLISVIVRELPGAGSAPERAVEDAGGSVGRPIGIIDSFVAEVPERALNTIQSRPDVYSVTPNGSVKLMAETPTESPSPDESPETTEGTVGEAEPSHCSEGLGYDSDTQPGAMGNVTKAINAGELWERGHRGQGVGVAVIDSGVVPVDGLTTPGKVVNGPDLSFDSQGPKSIRHMDTYGHGTHMAGIIAGRSDGATVTGNEYKDNCRQFVGVAPSARIVNVKVANTVGATDVSQVLAGIDWVVQHRNDNGMNIRVLNLSFGTDGVQDYMIDPLTYAAEVAWQKGIVVVVSAGNSGFGNPQLNNPAYDPYVIAVGAVDTKGTSWRGDDSIPDWSARGNGVRNPDVAAPGTSIVSLRSGNSFLDANYPEGRVGDRFFRGSGTSQAAAVTSGAAALLLSQRPHLNPDQVKALLMSSAREVPNGDERAEGEGMIDLDRASEASTPWDADQDYPAASGTGSLEAARGSAHVELDGVPLSGEQDIFGTEWDGVSWSADAWDGVSWSGGDWNGVSWSGGGWDGVSWSGVSWSGVSWSGVSWSGVSWSGVSWSGVSWSGVSWSGVSWSGVSWSGVSWSGVSWSGVSWSGVSWSGVSWS
jgi:subtilisin family serine protease